MGIQSDGRWELEKDGMEHLFGESGIVQQTKIAFFEIGR